MIYRFGDFELDTARFDLRRGGRAGPVEPQVFELLVHLIEHRDRVVTRKDLYESIWSGRVVSEATLNSRIKAARAAIGDDGRSQSLIRTFHRRGYRFVAPVTEVDTHCVAAVGRKEQGGDVARIVAERETLDNLDLTLPSQPSVAVLPFRPMGDHASQHVLAEGLTHDVITQVARARWLFVVARGSAFKFRDGPFDPREVGRALGVRYVVQGDVQFSSGRVVVRAAIAEATTGAERWADRFDRALDDLIAIQAELAEAVVGSIEVEIEHAERERSLLKSPASLDAWGAYHRGCWHMYRFTPADYDRAEHYFRHSLELDRSAPRAYAGLSFIHWQRAFLELTPDRDTETRRAIERALESLALDPRDPSGHWALGRAYLLDGDLDEAIGELEAAVTLNPSSSVGQYSLSYALMQVGDAARSNEIVTKARRLSPYDVMTFAMYAVRAQNLAFLGQHAEAATFATRAAHQPNAHYHVVAIAAFCNLLAERLEAAREHYGRLRGARPDYSVESFLRAFRHQPQANAELVRRVFAELERLA
jgi:TolB-like protein/Flp pilus assembly protein TadD